MALVFCDSFDHYLVAEKLTKWTTTISNATTMPAGRFGTCLSCAAQVTGGGGQGQRITLPQSATWIVGAAISLHQIGTAVSLFKLMDSTTLQVDVRSTAAGLLQVTRNGTVLATGTRILYPGVWYFVELKCVINDATGSFELRIDETTEVSGSGVDTKNTANAYADGLEFLSNSAAGFSVDDLYVLDGSGSSPTNDFLGDVRVEVIRPSGNGNSSQLVGSDGNSTDNYLLVDETTPNGDTDYVESATIGEKDTYAFGNVTPATGTVYGLQVLPYVRKTDAGVRSIVSVARLSGTEVDSATKLLSTSYAYLRDIREAKPGGGVWTITDVNAAEFGVKVTA